MVCAVRFNLCLLRSGVSLIRSIYLTTLKWCLHATHCLRDTKFVWILEIKYLASCIVPYACLVCMLSSNINLFLNSGLRSVIACRLVLPHGYRDTLFNVWLYLPILPFWMLLSDELEYIIRCFKCTSFLQCCTQFQSNLRTSICRNGMEHLNK